MNDIIYQKIMGDKAELFLLLDPLAAPVTPGLKEIYKGESKADNDLTKL